MPEDDAEEPVRLDLPTPEPDPGLLAEAVKVVHEAHHGEPGDGTCAKCSAQAAPLLSVVGQGLAGRLRGLAQVSSNPSEWPGIERSAIFVADLCGSPGGYVKYDMPGATCGFYVAQGKTCARPVGHDKDPSSLHFHPEVDPSSRCDYRGDCLKDAGHRSAHLYLPTNPAPIGETYALARVLARALRDGQARVVYHRRVGSPETWWLQVDRTRVSATERELIHSMEAPPRQHDPWDSSCSKHLHGEPSREDARCLVCRPEASDG